MPENMRSDEFWERAYEVGRKIARETYEKVEKGETLTLPRWFKAIQTSAPVSPKDYIEGRVRSLDWGSYGEMVVINVALSTYTKLCNQGSDKPL